MTAKPKVPASPLPKREDNDTRVRLDLSRAQFMTLLKIVFMGETMANGYRTDDRIEEYMDLDQTILKLAGQEGFHNLVVYDEELGMHFPSQELDETVSNLIDDFEEASFWEEAAFRLAIRDLARIFGEKGIGKLSQKKYASELFRHADRYSAEFENHGLDRLEIIDPSSGQTGS